VATTVDRATGNNLLDSVDADGVTLEILNEDAVLDTAVFDGTDCRRKKRQGPVVCYSKPLSRARLRISFKLRNKRKLVVKATLMKRTLENVGGFASITAPELHIATESVLGTLTVTAAKCKAFPRKVQCQGSA
jgi:hypothetical protein